MPAREGRPRPPEPGGRGARFPAPDAPVRPLLSIGLPGSAPGARDPPLKAARGSADGGGEEGGTLPRQDTTQVRVQQHYERIFASGQLIFDEGEPGEVLYVIQSGRVELSRQGTEGRRRLAELGPGDFFGEMGVVVGEPRNARAVALDECRLIELDGETFEAMLVDRPEVAIRVIRRLTDRLIESERRLSSLGLDELLRPLVRALVRHARPDGEGTIHLAGSLRELAENSGLSLHDTHRALHQLLDRKLVRIADDVLVTRDVEQLSASLDAPC